jgi:hypothetical protein
VTLVFGNQSDDATASYRVYLGCSTQPAPASERLGGRSAGPLRIKDLQVAGGEDGNWSVDACTSDISECVSVASATHRLKGWATKRITLSCPKDYQWFTGTWTRLRSSNAISVIQDSLDPDDTSTSGAFLLTNWDPTSSHSAVVAIACSADCRYAPGGCSTDCMSGCLSDPGCETEGPVDTICAGEGENQQCWTAWTEDCSNGVVWSCDTALFRVCCRTC